MHWGIRSKNIRVMLIAKTKKKLMKETKSSQILPATTNSSQTAQEPCYLPTCPFSRNGSTSYSIRCRGPSTSTDAWENNPRSKARRSTTSPKTPLTLVASLSSDRTDYNSTSHSPLSCMMSPWKTIPWLSHKRRDWARFTRERTSRHKSNSFTRNWWNFFNFRFRATIAHQQKKHSHNRVKWFKRK